MSFLSLAQEVGALFTSSGLDLYPDSYKGDISNESLFGRYSIVLPSGSSLDHERNTKLEGLVVVRIFYERGLGESSAYTFADSLTSTLQNYNSETTYIGVANLSGPADDADNKALAYLMWQAPITQYS